MRIQRNFAKYLAEGIAKIFLKKCNNKLGKKVENVHFLIEISMVATGQPRTTWLERKRKVAQLPKVPNAQGLFMNASVTEGDQSLISD